MFHNIPHLARNKIRNIIPGYLRKVYDINLLLGDLGGIAGVLCLIIGFFIEPISEVSFIMKSAKRMFLVKTRKDDLFTTPKTRKSIGKFVAGNREDGIKYHRVINLKKSDKCCLYLQNLMGPCFICRICWKNRSKLNKLFEKTQERLDIELDIVKLIRNIRNSKYLLQSSLMNPEIKFQLAHTAKNYINIDSSSSEDETQSPMKPNI